MGWGGFLDNITKWLTPEAHRRRLRRKIAKLEKKRDKLFAEKADIRSARRFNTVLAELQTFKRELQGD